MLMADMMADGFGDGRRRAFGGQADMPPEKWACGEPLILSSLLPAGIAMGLDVAGAALAAQQ